LGRYGRLPLGFPPDWVYQSAFGKDYESALQKRIERSPLSYLQDMDLEQEKKALRKGIGREPTQEEVVMYCNHPGDALKTIDFCHQYGDPNQLPLHAWFEGLEPGEEIFFNDRRDKPHQLLIRDVTDPDEGGVSVVRYTLDSEEFSLSVQVQEPSRKGGKDVELADPNDPYQVAAPSNGDLWVMHVQPGEQVRKGEEIFNISIMKQEKAVLAPVDGVVERVIKTADYMEDKKMVAVKEGELLVVLAPPKRSCLECGAPLPKEGCTFCPSCGARCAD
jgi:pyruvate carboxylase